MKEDKIIKEIGEKPTWGMKQSYTSFCYKVRKYFERRRALLNGAGQSVQGSDTTEAK